MKRFAIIYLAICWAFVIFMIMTWPMPYVYSPESKITFYDKGIHIVLFGILTYLIILIGFSFKKNYFIIALTSFVVSFNYITISEYLQGSIPGRSPTYPDLLAGLVGTLMAIVFGYLMHHAPKQKLLLHVCCATCASYLVKILRKNFKLSLYFYNPNIYPKSEYDLRLKDVRRIAHYYGVRLIEGKYGHAVWKKAVRGHAKDKEGGKRCEICYKYRLEATAKKASELRIPYFATTLAISPQKDAEIINKIGEHIAAKHELEYLDEEFEEGVSYAKSLEIAKKMNLYRQEYCGCEYSIVK